MLEPSATISLACEYVILVDAEDNPLGQVEKRKAHETGLLHRAFSVFLFDLQGRMLIQRRASSKYHSPNLWANACCGHPRPEEPLIQAARRRLKEELGVQEVEPLRSLGVISYHLNLGDGMQEHEYTHLLTGIYEGLISPATEEVRAYEWVEPDQLMDELQVNPSFYARWFRLYAHKKLGEEKIFEKALNVAREGYGRC
ncbi:MAG: isopentenyl-diphosphate Delta-isomerase [Alphaproteobacteria bacterium]